MKLYITGEITDEPWEGCFSPTDLKNALDGVDENEPLEVEITSAGGSVFAGLQCANILARWKGTVTTHAVGFCASIATVILMAGDKIVVDDNCFCLCHLPWSCVQGNKNDMEKEIEALEKCKVAMMTYYMKHAKVSEEEIDKLLEDEVWLLGNEFADIFDVEVLACDEQMNIAAKFDLSKYKNIPQRIRDMEKIDVSAKAEEEKKEEEKTEEVIEETSTEETSEPDEEEEKPEEEEPTIDDLKEALEKANERIAELEKQLAECGGDKEKKDEKKDLVTREECEKRVHGMQASMQKQINDFENQLKERTQELTKANAEITRLNGELENTSMELSKVASALEEKKNALEKLNSMANSAPVELPTYREGLAKCASPKEISDFIKGGKYKRG